MFAPRGDRAKRSSILPQVRVDDEEMAAVRWLHQHMRAKDTRRYTVSDVIRMAIARMYEAEQGPAHPAEQPADHARPGP